MNNALGVLCECLESGEYLHGGSGLSLSLDIPPTPVTFYPHTVSYELVASSAVTGTTHVIRGLMFAADGLVLDVFPSSGVLPPGGGVVVQVQGTPMSRDVGGSLTSSFAVTSVGGGSSGPASGIKLYMHYALYLCDVNEYALPVYGDDGDDDDEFSCQNCATLTGAEGVNPGGPKSMLPIMKRY